MEWHTNLNVKNQINVNPYNVHVIQAIIIVHLMVNTAMNSIDNLKRLHKIKEGICLYRWSVPMWYLNTKLVYL